MALGAALTKGLMGVGGELIDRLFPDPEQKAKAQRELEALEQEGELKKLSARMSAIVTEAESEDPWTSRARPSFLYVFYFITFSLVLVAPFLGVFYPDQMSQFFVNVKAGFAAIPEEMWWVFSAGYLGYATNRTREKRAKILGK